MRPGDPFVVFNQHGPCFGVILGTNPVRGVGLVRMQNGAALFEVPLPALEGACQFLGAFAVEVLPPGPEVVEVQR